MTDDAPKPAPRVDNSFNGQDPRTIEVSSPVELEYWVKFFMTTEDQLHAAISAVGYSAQPVRDWLARTASDTPPGDGDERPAAE